MRPWMRDRLTQGGMNAAPTGNVGGALMRPWMRDRLTPGRHECHLCEIGRGRIYAPLKLRKKL